MKPIESYWKIDHTICMNSNEGNIKWNIDNKDDKTLYGENQEGYDPIDTDCKSIDEAIDCLETIEKAVKALDIIREKQVDISSLNCAETVEQYNIKENGFIPLTQEEFELLKEVLKNE